MYVIKVKYNEKFSHDGYEYRCFDNYEDFGYWYIKNYKTVDIWDIKVDE